MLISSPKKHQTCANHVALQIPRPPQGLTLRCSSFRARTAGTRATVPRWLESGRHQDALRKARASCGGWWGRKRWLWCLKVWDGASDDALTESAEFGGSRVFGMNTQTLESSFVDFCVRCVHPNVRSKGEHDGTCMFS